jgi:hypothetical protein
MLLDILTDMAVCEIEGWNKIDYIKEIKELIDSINQTKTTKLLLR